MQIVEKDELQTNKLSRVQRVIWIATVMFVPSILGYVTINILLGINNTPSIEDTNIRVLLAHSIISALFSVIVIHQLMKIDHKIICKERVSTGAVVGFFFVWLLIVVSYSAISEEFSLEKSNFLHGLNISILDLALAIIAICIIAPVFEETIYRGAFFSLLLNHNKSNKFIVLLISSIAFTFIHFQYGIAELSFVFVMGIFFGIVRLTTNNLTLCIGFHMINNVYALSSFIVTQ